MFVAKGVISLDAIATTKKRTNCVSPLLILGVLIDSYLCFILTKMCNYCFNGCEKSGGASLDDRVRHIEQEDYRYALLCSSRAHRSSAFRSVHTNKIKNEVQ